VGLQIIFAGIAISLLLLIPLSIKWQVQLKKSLPGAIVIGVVAGIITGTTSDFAGGLSSMGQLSLETFVIIGLAAGSVAYMFYRDPERDTPKQGGVMVSPADGTVIYVKEIKRGQVPLSTKKGRRFKLKELTQTGLAKDGAYLIGIGMNLLNVHVNRAPIAGKVEVINHIRGDFLSLKRPEAVLANERLTTVFDGGQFKVATVQIASRLVRRIETYLTEGQAVEKGQRIGMIKFGSQVDLVVPKLAGLRIKARPGDEVMAGVSVLVKYRDRNSRSRQGD